MKSLNKTGAQGIDEFLMAKINNNKLFGSPLI
jgi:hypothetical protein